MSGIPKIEIQESAEELRELMKKQKNSLEFAKLQTLYLFKINAAETVRYMAVLIGRGESTIHRWLKVYRESGIKALLKDVEEEKDEEISSRPPGRPQAIDVEIAAQIQQELKEEEGFSSYQEVKLWLEIVQGVEVSYISIWRFCRLELQAKLKVPRPRSIKQEKGAIDKFKSELPKRISSIVHNLLDSSEKDLTFRYWCGDESRFGCQTIEGKKLTMKGVKPHDDKQWKFDYYYLYGLVEPKSGETFYYEFSHLDASCFETFLQLFSEQYPEEIQILQLDNAPSHTTPALEIPDNIILLFQPPYTPEVNPIERLWEHVKSFLKWMNFETLDTLRDEVGKILKKTSQEIVRSLTGWDFILEALSLSGI
jgi:transposase